MVVVTGRQEREQTRAMETWTLNLCLRLLCDPEHRGIEVQHLLGGNPKEMYCKKPLWYTLK